MRTTNTPPTATLLASWPAPPALDDVIVAFTVEGRPQPWQRPGQRAGESTMIGGKRVQTRRPHRYTPKATAAYEALVAGRALAAMPAGRRQPIQGARLGVHLVWDHPGEPLVTHLDVDNVVKSVFDGMNLVVWHDDRQVEQLTVAHRWRQPIEQLHVAVYRMAEQP